MADINQSKVDLLVNGQQAEKELKQVRDRVESLRQKLEEAFRSGTKESQKYFQGELRKAQSELRKMESGVKAVERTMLHLDKATPNDLNKALKYMNAELKNIERGSSAWNAQVAKIRQVKAELDKVNEELRQSESLFVRVKNTVNGWGASIAAGAAAVSGLVMAGKAAVNAYAEMEQEEANVRKYTGMTAEQVAHLNEEFKKMDTRTSREGLNQLAQEAGRLGKQSEEDVLGFVKAADKINVALDELGEGATLTLSKLTTIFGDEERLGTEQSLLAVGSVINELSQNCTASAPYLAEFGQRLAGVGAQANMTIPEIMGFGAVLDSQGQKVEMSATALSKVIMKMFQDPAKIAEATGMSVKEFSETCKRSSNEGLLMLLERLNELGGIDSLAPVFADMGEKGARASTVLMALAGNVDEVRKQQEAANIAFTEATSIDKEFEVQNTTVQAELEKRRKEFNEMAVALGEKLLPVMGYFHSSMSMTMRALSTTIDFIIKYKGELLALGAVIASYAVGVRLISAYEKAHAAFIAAKTAVMTTHKAVVLLCSTAYNKMTGNVVRANAAQKMYRDTIASSSALTKLHVAVTSLHKTAVLAASVAYNKLTGNTLRANAAQKLLKVTMATTPWGAVLAGVAALVAVIIKLANRTNEAAIAAKNLADIRSEAAQKIGEEQTKIELLVKAAENENLSMEERRKAVEKLNAIIPGYNAQLDETTGKYTANKAALDNYLVSLRRKYELEGAKEKLKELGSQKADLNIQKAQAEQQLEEEKKRQREQSATQATVAQSGSMSAFNYSTTGGAYAPQIANQSMNNTAVVKAAEIRVAALDKQLKGITTQEEAILGVYGDEIEAAEAKFVEEMGNGGQSGGGGSKGTGGGGSKSKGKKGKGNKGHQDEFKAEKEWKAKQEALNKESYAKGEIDKEAFEKRQLEIEIDYQKKIYEKAKEGSQAQLEAKAAYFEAKKKLEEMAAQNDFGRQKAENKLAYLQGEKSHKEYTQRQLELDVEETKARLDKQVEGTQSYLDAQVAYLEAKQKLEKEGILRSVETEKEGYEELQMSIKQQYANGEISTRAYNLALEQAELQHLQNMVSLYKEGSEEYLKAEREYQRKSKEYQIKHAEDTKKIMEDMKNAYFSLVSISDANGFADEMAQLNVAFDELSKIEMTNEQKLDLEKAYQQAKFDIAKKYNMQSEMEALDSAQATYEKMADLFESEGAKKFISAYSTMVDGLSNLFSGVTDFMDAELSLQTALIEKRYDAEIAAAGNNTRMVKQLEAEKEAEIAKMKTEAADKEFKMNIAMAIAQGALSAINAWNAGVGAGFPAGLVLGPLMMAMSLTATGLQIAAMTKQHEAAMAQGFASGGYTMPGKKYKPAGIVHAGEWVASQELLANPTAAATIAQLDQAQRTNTIGQLDRQQVSASVSAPVAVAQASDRSSSYDNGLVDSIRKLNRRLDEPIYAQSTVTGDRGTLRANNKYEQLMRNKSKK